MPIDYVSFFLNSESRVVEYETLDIYAPGFLERYRIVVNNSLGITASIETGEQVFFRYYPALIELPSESDDLDQVISITLGDVGEIISNELDRIHAQDSFNVKPTVIYRTFRSDYLLTSMKRYVLEISELHEAFEGSTFEAKPPVINMVKTGEIYSLVRFTALKSVL